MEPIIVFGRGKYFKEKEEAVKSKYDIIGFLDNQVEKKEYDEEYKCYVYNPSYVTELSECNILCMSIHFVAMWKQLILLKVPEKRIYFGVNILPIHTRDKMLFSNNENLIAKNGKLEYISVKHGNVSISSVDEYDELKRRVYRKEFPEIDFLKEINVKPISSIFGGERGKAVDRYYIENFLKRNSESIRGDVMEIASNDYIQKYGAEKVTSEVILHVEGWGRNAIKGNFETGEGLKENMIDCLICTQTLQYIYDLKSAIRNIFMILKPGGVGLFTVPGIKSLSMGDNRNWGDYWSFTPKSALRLFGDEFGKENVEVETFGNVKVAMAYLYGLCLEDMKIEDMDYCDEQFPFLITVKVAKNKE